MLIQMYVFVSKLWNLQKLSNRFLRTFSGNYSSVFAVYDNFKCLVCRCISLTSFDKRFRNLSCKHAPSEGEKKIRRTIRITLQILSTFQPTKTGSLAEFLCLTAVHSTHSHAHTFLWSRINSRGSPLAQGGKHTSPMTSPFCLVPNSNLLWFVRNSGR